MKDFNSIWQKPIYLPYLQPTLTDEILNNAEKKLGYSLPKELVALLQIQNGGYIRKTLEESLHSQIYGIGPYFPSLTDVDWTDYKDWVSFELNGLIPFDGDGHWYICLDYRKNHVNPQITYIDTECDSQKLIANSFLEYLTQLIIEVEDEYVIETNEPIEQVAQNISQLLNITFNEPDTFAQGYPTYSGEVNTSRFWLTPNTVPYGFIRKGEDRYAELSHLMNEKATQFPEIADGCMFISFSDDEIGDEILDKLRLSMKITPLSEFL